MGFYEIHWKYTNKSISNASSHPEGVEIGLINAGNIGEGFKCVLFIMNYINN